MDRDLCEANAVCEAAVPEVFAVDDNDELTIRVSQIPDELAGRVRDAVGSCPRMALRIEEQPPT